MTITALTCTKDRPEAFALCEKYMARQTRKPDQWLVLDDGDEPAKCTMGQRHIYCPEIRGRGTSMIEKLKIAFGTPGLITGDAVVVWEDDDWMHPTWIAVCEANLSQNVLLFGEGRSIYYNVQERWWFQHVNMGHASLCSTAFRRELYPLMLTLARDPNPFIDARLWANWRGRKLIIDPAKNPGSRPLVVGIKAMPGAKGYSVGHSKRDPSAKDDHQLAKLLELVGDDANAYEPYCTKYKPLPKPKVPFHNETGRVRGPNWLRWLEHLIDKPDVHGLEFGTFRGESAEFMLENIFTGKGASYICIDPFTGSAEHQRPDIDCTTLERDTRERLAKFNNAAIIRGYSQDVFELVNGKFHFLYVDGDHTSKAALRDAVLGFELLEIGGVMVWDDYEWNVFPRPQDCPKLGVDAFLSAYADFIEVLEPRGWQIAIKKVK